MDEAVEEIRQMFIAVFGGTPEELPDRYVASSPITYAETVDARLLVIHGRDDGRCPAGQMQRYLDRMAALDKAVTTEWFSGGHLGGVANPSLLREHTRLMLEFASSVRPRQGSIR